MKGQAALVQAESLTVTHKRAVALVSTHGALHCFHWPAGSYLALCHAGEAFDKVARLLGLDLRPNGGAALEAFAKQGDPYRFKFTVPLQRHIDCNFSYAGLKNSVRLAIEAEAPGAATDANLQVCLNISVVCRACCIVSTRSLQHWQPALNDGGRHYKYVMTAFVLFYVVLLSAIQVCIAKHLHIGLMALVDSHSIIVVQLTHTTVIVSHLLYRCSLFYMAVNADPSRSCSLLSAHCHCTPDTAVSKSSSLGQRQPSRGANHGCCWRCCMQSNAAGLP